jgi:hypothetical protein
MAPDFQVKCRVPVVVVRRQREPGNLHDFMRPRKNNTSPLVASVTMSKMTVVMTQYGVPERVYWGIHPTVMMATNFNFLMSCDIVVISTYPDEVF